MPDSHASAENARFPVPRRHAERAMGALAPREREYAAFLKSQAVVRFAVAAKLVPGVAGTETETGPGLAFAASASVGVLVLTPTHCPRSYSWARSETSLYGRSFCPYLRSRSSHSQCFHPRAAHSQQRERPFHSPQHERRHEAYPCLCASPLRIRLLWRVLYHVYARAWHNLENRQQNEHGAVNTA